MPHTDTTPVSASIASVGKGIRYIGNWVYGYSGSVSVDTSETDLISATSGSGLIVAKWHPFYQTSSANNFAFYAYLNKDLVQYVEVTSSEADTPYTGLSIIIPPFTILELKSKNLAAGSHNMLATITGRVYGAE